MKKSLIFAVCGIFAVLSFTVFAGVADTALVISHLHENAIQGLPLLGAVGMTTLSNNVARSFELGELNDVGVIADDIIYEGSAVGDNGSGYGRPLVAGDPFLGFATEKADNAGGAAGAVNVNLKHAGRVKLAISGLAITDVGKQVYASDDNTFTLTATSNSAIGRVIRWVSTGVGIVEYDVGRGGVGVITALTDSTTGTADGTVADVGAAFSQATLNNNFKELVVKINALAAQIK